MRFNAFPRHPLAFLPTPLVELKRLSQALGGPRILMKRDDQTGLGFGGNKTRKLEFLIADALRNGCDTVMTAGAAQSNHCRQTAAAAASTGLSCHLVLGGEAPEIPDGNLLLDQLFGAVIHWTGDQRKGEQIPEIETRLVASGKKPYVIPYGGSNAVGALGFAAAAEELQSQLSQREETISAVVFASSSGGTQAGLTLGAKICGLEAELIGIGIDKGEAGEQPYSEFLTDLTNALARKTETAANFTSASFHVLEEYSTPGYGVVGALEREAIRWTAQLEGILLDPVYTGRAMGGLMDLIRKKRWDSRQTVVFWHTGGTPALFPYAAALTDNDIDRREF